MLEQLLLKEYVDFFENTYNILTISNKKVDVDLKIIGGKRLSMDEMVNNYNLYDNE